MRFFKIGVPIGGPIGIWFTGRTLIAVVKRNNRTRRRRGISGASRFASESHREFSNRTCVVGPGEGHEGQPSSVQILFVRSGVGMLFNFSKGNLAARAVGGVCEFGFRFGHSVSRFHAALCQLHNSIYVDTFSATTSAQPLVEMLQQAIVLPYYDHDQISRNTLEKQCNSTNTIGSAPCCRSSFFVRTVVCQICER